VTLFGLLPVPVVAVEVAIVFPATMVVVAVEALALLNTQYGWELPLHPLSPLLLARAGQAQLLAPEQTVEIQPLVLRALISGYRPVGAEQQLVSVGKGALPTETNPQTTILILPTMIAT
jgi:hypothetical protein